jgi:hypothetical protein
MTISAAPEEAQTWPDAIYHVLCNAGVTQVASLFMMFKR